MLVTRHYYPKTHESLRSAKKEQKGFKAWVPDTQAARIGAILEAGNRLDEFNRIVGSMKNPSPETVNVLKKEYGVIGTKNLLERIDRLLLGYAAVGDGLTEYLTPTPETPITGYKQVEWVEPAQAIPPKSATPADPVKSLTAAVSQLIGHTSKNREKVSGMITAAKAELGLVGRTQALPAADKVAIFNHIVSKVNRG